MKTVQIVLVLVLLGLGAWWLFRDVDGRPVRVKAAAAPAKVEIRDVGKPAAVPAAAKKAEVPLTDKTPPAAAPEAAASGTAPTTDDDVPPAEQKVIDSLQDALDDNDFKKVGQQLGAAANAKHPAVRAKAVEALQWFGKKALPELTGFLADPDDDVKSAAESAVEQALSEVDDEREKIGYIESLVSVKGACSKDCLTMLSGQLNGFSDETLTVSAALRVIEGNQNPDAVKSMKEVYAFATGEEYTDAAAAKAWLQKKQAEAAEAEKPDDAPEAEQ